MTNKIKNKFTAMHVEKANSYKSSLCSLSLVDYADGIITQENSWLIKPPSMRFDAADTYKHGLSKHDFIEAETLYELWKQIKPFFENRTIVAFNANYQISLLISSFKYYCGNNIKYLDFKGESLPDFDFMCLFHLVVETYVVKSNKLDILCNSLDFNVDEKNCLSMAKGCGFLTNKVLQDLQCSDFMQVKRKLNITLGERFTYKKLFGDNELTIDYLPCVKKRDINPYFKKLQYI